MNKNSFIFFWYLWFGISAGLAMLVLPVCGQEAVGPLLSPPDAVPVLWASGNDRGVYLLAAREQQQTPGYQLYFRDLVREAFLPGLWYPGIPEMAVLHQERLLVFLQGGGCQSYSLTTEPRTERRLPAGLRLLDCCSQEENLYALVMVEKPADPIAVFDSTGAVLAPEAGEPASPAASGLPEEAGPQTVSLSAGHYLILRRGKDWEWRGLSAESFELPSWSQLRLAVHGETIHLFGIQTGEGSGSDSAGSLQHFQYRKDRLVPAEALSLDRVSAYSPLMVNRQLLLVAFCGAGEEQKPDPLLAQIQIGRRNGDIWQFVPVQSDHDGKPWVVEPDHMAAAAFGQNIAFFEWKSEKDIRFGYVSPQEKVLTLRAQPIRAVEQTPLPLLQWLENPAAGVAFMAAAGTLLFWRRRQVFSTADPLPKYMAAAPLWRRLTAFLLDIFVIILFLQIPLFIAVKLAPDALRPLQMDSYSLEQLQHGMMDPLVGKLLLVFWAVVILYFLVFETVFGTTAGKLAMGLVILGEDGKVVRRRQMLVRNLVRILEIHPQMFFPVFLVILFTRNKQRFGDLAARTIVVLNTPELRVRLENSSVAGLSPEEKESSGEDS